MNSLINSIAMPGLGIALTLVGLGSQAFATAQSAQANNALRQKLLERSNTLDDVFKRDMSMDYMATPGVKNTLAAYGQRLKDVQKNSEGRAVMAGASPESVIAGKEAVNENYGDFIRKVASGGEAYRADKERNYTVRRDRLDDQIYASDAAKASQWDNFTKNATNLGVAGISAGAIGKDADTGGIPGNTFGGMKTANFLKNALKKKLFDTSVPLNQ